MKREAHHHPGDPARSFATLARHPGIKTVNLHRSAISEIRDVSGFAKLAPNCFFRDCTTPMRMIAPFWMPRRRANPLERYESYLRILESLE